MSLRRDTLVGAVVLLAVVVSLYRVFALPLNHDVGWLLYVSDRVLQGDRLYVDLIEVNPPLIVWLGVPVILLERLLGVHHTVLFPVIVALGACCSIAACWLMSADAVADAYRPPVIAALAAALFVVPSGNWGQREHLMLVLAAPYIFACAARARGADPGGSVPVGIAAGIGFAIKPHFLLLPIAYEAWLWLSRRTIWPGAAVMAGTIGTYAIAVLVFSREYVPMMLELREAYSTFASHSLGRMLLHPPSLFIGLTLPLAFLRGEEQALRRVLGITAVASLVIATVQGKAFFYHFIPGLAAVILLVALAFVTLGTWRRRPSLATLPTLLAALLLLTEVVARPPAGDVRWEKVADVRAAAANQPVVVLGVALGDSWPFINYARADWTLALPSVWLARPDVAAGDRAARHVAQALEAGPVVLVPTQHERAALPELLNHQVFRNAWAEYSQTESLRHYRVYRSTGGTGVIRSQR